MSDIDINPSSMDSILGVWIGPLMSQNVPYAIRPQLFDSSAVVLHVMWLDSPYRAYGWDSISDIDIIPSSMGPIFRGGKDKPLSSQNGPSAIGSQLFGNSAVL